MRHARVVVLLAAVAAVVVSVVVGVGGAAQRKIDASKPPVRVALIAIKLPAVDVLTPYQTGISAAFKQINARGGFGGRRAVLETCNSMLQAAVTTLCAQRTSANKPVAAITCELQWEAAGQKIYDNAGISSWGCKNTPGDFTNKHSFGTSIGTFGEQRAIARYLCERSNVRRIVVLNPDLPQQRVIGPEAQGRVYRNCGKTVDYVYAPLGGVAFDPYVNKAMESKPDYVVSSHSGAAFISMVKLFNQAGLPSTKIAGASNVFDSVALKGNESTLNGVVAAFETKNFDDTKDPEVAAYTKAVKSSGKDPKLSVAQFGYANAMFFYEVAKRVGFDKFNATSLQRFMNSPASKGMRLPLGRTIAYPGPKAYPAVRHPWAQMVVLKNGKLNIVKAGPKKDGWVLAY
jgi:ABC-type branched-subunit amino acid transport system substrate-binding protein